MASAATVLLLTPSETGFVLNSFSDKGLQEGDVTVACQDHLLVFDSADRYLTVYDLSSRFMVQKTKYRVSEEV